MNLVKAQEYAASLPLAELKKYADGLNPSMIPPWLATGEMEAKTKRMEMANNLAAAAQGQKPSIKEQVEKKAGLMALQQAQMAQQQGAAAAPRPGGPVPEGTPEPEQQPQQEAGLDQLQSNIQMAGGGIVAFSGEDGDSEVEGKKKLRQVTQRELAEEYNRKRFGQLTAEEQARYEALLSQIPTDGNPTVTGGERVEGSELGRNIQNTAMALPGASAARAVSGSAGSARGLMAALAALVGRGTPADQPAPNVASAPVPVADAETEKLKRLAAARANTGVSQNQQIMPGATKPPISNIAQLAAAQNKPVASAAPAAPAAPAPESMEAMLRDSFKNKPPERKIDDLIAEQKTIDKALGLDEPAGKAKLERIAALKDQYQATQKSPLQELIAMLGQAGQYKGLSGMAPAYTSMAEKKREADLKHAKDINELMGGVEDTQRGEKTATKTKVGAAREKDIENARAFDREKMQTLGTARGQDVQAASSKYNADMHYKAAMAQMANANVRQDAQEKRLLLDSFKTRIASIDKELAPLLKTPYGPAKAQIAELQAEKAGLTKALDETSGIAKIAGAPSAASPSGTTRMRFDAQGNQIK